MMLVDEALELVLANGAVATRPTWGPDEFVYRFRQDMGEIIISEWRSTRPIMTVDAAAEDWLILGTLN